MSWIDKVFRQFYFGFHIITKCIGIMNDRNVLNNVNFYRILCQMLFFCMKDEGGRRMFLFLVIL